MLFELLETWESKISPLEFCLKQSNNKQAAAPANSLPTSRRLLEASDTGAYEKLVYCWSYEVTRRIARAFGARILSSTTV